MGMVLTMVQFPLQKLQEYISNPETFEKDLMTLEESHKAIPKTQEPGNMEVHHHPDLHHKSKKWKEYFLEFLMIFLAVTTGFIAENLREHIKDNSEIRNDMQSMVADLQRMNKETTPPPFMSSTQLSVPPSLMACRL